MLFIRILRWFSGYIRVQVSGGFCERFINLCVSNGISVWNTHKRKEFIELYMPARSYKKAALLRRKCFVKLKIIGRYGLPFYLNRYKTRKGLFVGAAVYLAILITMPNFIWNIEIVGNKRIPTETVMAALEEMGIAQGTPIGKINGESDRNELNLRVGNIAWSSLNVVGTTLKVEMRETLDTDTDKDSRYCNVVAKCNGEVMDVYAEQGTAIVKRGAKVKKGDLLISGTEEYKNKNTYFRHANGKVLAKTKHRLTVTLPINETIHIRTGDTEKRTLISFFGLDIPLFAGSVKYDHEKEIATDVLTINSVSLPISRTRAVFYKTEKKKVSYSQAQLKAMALEKLKDEKEKNFKNVKILTEKIKTETRDNSYILTASYVCEEDIGKTVYFEVDESFSE